LCKSEVIQIQVIAGNDDGNDLGGLVKMPVIQADIYIFVGYGLEKHFGGKMYSGFLHA